MAEVKGNKKRPTINLSFFTPSSTTDSNNNNYSCNPSTKPTSSTKSPKNKFEEPNGVVGLGIVVAHDHPNLSSSSRNAIFAVSPRSNPIPIFSKGRGGGGGSSCQEMMELSEEYTCVISHVGKNVIKKREYFDDGELGMESTKRSTGYWAVSSANEGGGGVFCAASPVDVGMGQVFQTEDFLSYCFLCKKKLLGLDIFMYRGEKAFCSAECRYKQMSVDEHKEKCGSGVKKPLEYSVSPCSGPMQFHTGVAAA